MKNKINIALVFSIALIVFSGCSKDDEEDVVTSDPAGHLINESYFNSGSLMSFEIITATLENGTSAECFEITFSSNPVASGPFCPETINDIGGIAIYDGATDPGMKALAAELLNNIEADGYDMVNADGTVNIDDFSGGMPDETKSYCLDAAPDDNLELTFIIPVTPQLASSNNEIGEVEFIGLSVDGVPIAGDPPSAINGPMMGGPGGSGDQMSMPSIDPCGGHHDPAGYYHWHFAPAVMNQVLAANDVTEVSCTLMPQTDDAELFGFAKDGYPIYAYATEPTDLDDCGGRTAATTEYPDGQYHYVASTTIAPNVPQCLKGVAAQNAFTFN